jgi:soluble lytic murein transglycosylase
MEATRSSHRSPPRRSAGRARPHARGRQTGQARRRRWGFGILVAVILGAVVGFLIASGDFNRAIREFTLPLHHDDIIRQQAADKGVDASLIAAVIYSESRFHDQTSHAGARGLMPFS